MTYVWEANRSLNYVRTEAVGFQRTALKAKRVGAETDYLAGTTLKQKVKAMGAEAILNIVSEVLPPALFNWRYRMTSPGTQELTIRVGALEHALALSLRRIAAISGLNAKAEIEALRDQSIGDFKNSGISADREMDHAKIVRPAIDVLEAVFKHALKRLAA